MKYPTHIYGHNKQINERNSHIRKQRVRVGAVNIGASQSSKTSAETKPDHMLFISIVY